MSQEVALGRACQPFVTVIPILLTSKPKVNQALFMACLRCIRCCTTFIVALINLGESIPSVLKGMYSYSPYSHLMGNVHHIPRLNLDFRKAFFQAFFKMFQKRFSRPGKFQAQLIVSISNFGMTTNSYNKVVAPHAIM